MFRISMTKIPVLPISFSHFNVLRHMLTYSSYKRTRRWFSHYCSLWYIHIQVQKGLHSHSIHAFLYRSCSWTGGGWTWPSWPWLLGALACLALHLVHPHEILGSGPGNYGAPSYPLTGIARREFQMVLVLCWWNVFFVCKILQDNQPYPFIYQFGKAPAL